MEVAPLVGFLGEAKFQLFTSGFQLFVLLASFQILVWLAWQIAGFSMGGSGLGFSQVPSYLFLSCDFSWLLKFSHSYSSGYSAYVPPAHLNPSFF